jgi:hypothetical protein
VFIRTISVLLDSICYELYMVTLYSVPDIDLLSLIIAYQGDLGYQDAVDSADAVAKARACPFSCLFATKSFDYYICLTA